MELFCLCLTMNSFCCQVRCSLFLLQAHSFSSGLVPLIVPFAVLCNMVSIDVNCLAYVTSTPDHVLITSLLRPKTIRTQ